MNQQISGAASALSLKKKEKAVPDYYKSQSSHLQCDIPFFPQPPLGTESNPVTKSFLLLEASVSHRFILYLIALAYVALPFCVPISDKIACFIRTKYLFHIAQVPQSRALA